MLKQILLIALFAPIALSITEGSFHVTGHLMCNGKPYAGETVRVYDKNYMLADVKLSYAFTNADGVFDMSIWGQDWFSFDPYLYVPNYCIAIKSDEEKCSIGAMAIKIPTSFISQSRVPTSTFDIGTVDLAKEVKFEGMGLGAVMNGILVNTKECKPLH